MNTLSKIYLAAVAASVAILGAAPAAAGVTQSDISTCRAIYVQQNPGVLEDYRLRFKKARGVKYKTLYLEAIPNKSSAGERFDLTCKMVRRDGVVAVTIDPQIKLAGTSNPAKDNTNN